MNNFNSKFPHCRYLYFALVFGVALFTFSSQVMAATGGGGANVNSAVDATPDELIEVIKTAIMTGGAGLSQDEALVYAQDIISQSKSELADVAEAAASSVHEVAKTLGMLGRLEMVCNGDYSGALYDATVEAITEAMKSAGYGGPAIVTVGFALSALKLTHDSYKVVAQTKKELNVEILYYTIEADKGVTPKGKLPVFTDENLENLYQKLWVKGDKQLLRDYASTRLPPQYALTSNAMTEGVIETLRPGQNKENVMRVIAAVMADVKQVRIERMKAAGDAIIAAQKRKEAKIALNKALKAYQIVSEMDLQTALATGTQIEEAKAKYNSYCAKFSQLEQLQTPKDLKQAKSRVAGWQQVALGFTAVVHETRLLVNDSKAALNLYNNAVTKEDKAKTNLRQFESLVTQMESPVTSHPSSNTPSIAADGPQTFPVATPPVQKSLPGCNEGTVPLHYSQAPNGIWKCQKECPPNREAIYYTETIFDSGFLIERETLSCAAPSAQPVEIPETPVLSCAADEKVDNVWDDTSDSYQDKCVPKQGESPESCVLGAPGCQGYKPPAIEFNAPQARNVSWAELFAVSPKFAEPFKMLYSQGIMLVSALDAERKLLNQILQRQTSTIATLNQKCSQKLLNQAGENISLFGVNAIRNADVYGTEIATVHEVDILQLKKDFAAYTRLLKQLQNAKRNALPFEQQYNFAKADMDKHLARWAFAAQKYNVWKQRNRKAITIINENLSSLVSASQWQVDTQNGPKQLPVQVLLGMDEISNLSNPCIELTEMTGQIAINENALRTVFFNASGNQKADNRSFVALETAKIKFDGNNQNRSLDVFHPEAAISLSQQIDALEKRLFQNTLTIKTVIDGKTVQDETIVVMKKGNFQRLQQLKATSTGAAAVGKNTLQMQDDSLEKLQSILLQLQKLSIDKANAQQADALLIEAHTLPGLFTGQMDGNGELMVFSRAQSTWKKVMMINQQFIDMHMAQHK